MEILVEDHKVGDDALRRVNRVQKHQKVVLLSDIVTAGGEKVDGYYVKDWALGHERTTGKRLSDLVFGREYIPNKRGLGSVEERAQQTPQKITGVAVAS